MAATTKAVGLGLLVLLVVFSVPMMIDATTGQSTQTLELQEEENTFVTDRVNVTAENIQPPDPANATITVSDSQTLESRTKTIRNGTSATYQLSGGNVTVAITDIQTNPETFRATVGVDRTYGWSGPAKSVADELGLLFVVVGAIIIIGALGAMID